MKFGFHPEALEEYKGAAQYYEGCQPGLGQRFITAVEHAIQNILERPDQWKPIEKDVRRYLTRVFPYTILYYPRVHSYHSCNALPPRAWLLEASYPLRSCLFVAGFVYKRSQFRRSTPT